MHNPILLAFWLFFVLALTSLAASPVSAEPLQFHRPRGNFAVGFEVFDPLLGTFGEETRVGLTGYAQTHFQMGYWGLTMRIGDGLGLTEKRHLPHDEGYQIFYLTFGPRILIPTSQTLQLNVFIQPEITLNILHSNTLVEITGNDPYIGSAGGSVGIQWIMGVLVVEAQVSCQWMWHLDALMVLGGLNVGFGGTFLTQ